MLHLSLGAALAFAGVSSTVYALALCTPFGRRWATAQTWVTVVIGVALTLFWLATYDLQAANYAMIFFAVTGTPIVIRSLVLDFEEREHIRNHEE